MNSDGVSNFWRMVNFYTIEFRLLDRQHVWVCNYLIITDIVIVTFQKISLSFFKECVDILPSIVKLHAPNSIIWDEKLCEDGRSILNVESMINYYEIKSYYMIIFCYMWGPDFRFQIYNTYALEIPYHISSSKKNFDEVFNDQLDSVFILMLV